MKMDMEPDEKINAYETLIRMSLHGPWSVKHLAIEHAYRYHQHLCQQGKVETSAKQFVFVKKNVVKAVSRIRKKTNSKVKKRVLADVLLLLEMVEGINDVDRMISATLVIVEEAGNRKKKQIASRTS